MKLTIIIPVFNEEKTIDEILRRVDMVEIAKVEKEIIVVDDGSTDSTVLKIEKINLKNVNLIIHQKNLGKGAAVRTGIEHATGDYIIIQDADLEYNPKDIPKLMKQILSGRTKVVYGTRLNRLPNLKRDERTFQFLIHYFGNRFLSLLTSILCGQWITDMETGYKLFPKSALKNISLRSKSFNFEPEITTKLLKNGYKILEVPISTNPRGYDEGKKLHTLSDGAIALWTLFKYRLVD